MNYWALKRVGGDDLLVVPDKADRVKQLIESESDSFIEINGVTLKTSTITSVEPTSQLVKEDPKAFISAPEGWSDKKPPLEDGDVKCIDVKKTVTKKEYDSYHSKHHGYKFIETDGNMVTVSYTRAAHLGVPDGQEVA